MTVYFILIAYTIIVLALSLRTRGSSSVKDFVMGGYETAWYGVGASIFSLIGGGEIVALTALGFSYGYSALALFLGYAAGFVVLGCLAGRIRSARGDAPFVSLPDFIHARCGHFAGRLVFICSFAAFFALLMIQFSAGGLLVSAMASISYEVAAILIGLIVTTYLFVGGFRAVILTDILQGLARLILVVLLIAVFAFQATASTAGLPTVEALPMEAVVGLLLTGLFSAIASSDVWQRVYAARSDRDAAVGLVFGASAMMIFGALLVFIGLVAKAVAPTSVPDDAFSTALATGIPAWATAVAVALVVVSVLSTADTELFVLASLIGREAGRDGVTGLSALDADSPPRWVRIIVLLVGATSTGAALYFSNVVSVYVWLLSLLLTIAPAVCAAVFVKLDARVVGIGIVLNVGLFGALASLGQLTAETAYVIVLPGFLVLLALQGLVVARRMFHRKEPPE